MIAQLLSPSTVLSKNLWVGPTLGVKRDVELQAKDQNSENAIHKGSHGVWAFVRDQQMPDAYGNDSGY